VPVTIGCTKFIVNLTDLFGLAVGLGVSIQYPTRIFCRYF